ncbi:MAG: organomercurial lyase [Methylococcales bacterium]
MSDPDGCGPRTNHENALDPDGKAAKKPSLDELIELLGAAFPPLNQTEQDVSLGIYRMLRQGSPLTMRMLAADMQIPVSTIIEMLNRSWGVDLDYQNRIVGYRGLTVRPTNHCLELNDGQLLYAWCAFDTLFLPGILRTRARVESFCPSTGSLIRLIVGPEHLEYVQPKNTVVSFMIPQTARIKENVRDRFCHYVHFFQSKDAGLAWTGRHPGTFLLTINQAHTLGQKFDAIEYSRF